MKYVDSRRARVLMVGLAVALIVAAGGCAPAAPTSPVAGERNPTSAAVVKPSSAESRRGGTLRLGTSSEWNTLDPPLYTTVSERQIFYSIYDPLVGMNEDLSIVPHLARSWQVSADGLEWTFSLASGVKFHDGTPFNAQAAKFNLDRLMDPATGSALRQQVAAIKEVQAPDNLTIKIILSQPFTPLLAWLAEGPGFMASPTAVGKWGKEYGRHPVGTGPFEFVEWVKGDHLTLQRFKDYWESGLPYLDEVVFKPVRDPTVQLAGLRTATLDLVDDVAANEVAGLRAAQDRKLYELKGARWPMVRLNLAKPPLDNKAIRQALSLAIDRDAIVKAVYFGNATPAFGPISPTYKAVYDPAVEQFGFKRDVAKAKQKLVEGGQPNGFTLPLDITGTPGQTRLGELIKAQLAEIGVTVEIGTFEPTALTDRMTSRGFVAAVGSWTPRPDVDGTMYGHFHSTGNVNHVSYRNPKVDALLDRTRVLPPGDERIQKFREAQQLIVDDAPWIFLVFETKAMATLKSVEGLPLIPDTMVRPKTIYLSK
jgi:peptide/nickel transport system substrate-binding protein